MSQLAYSPSEVADLIGVHPQTVLRWLKSGRLPGRKVGGIWLVSAERLRDWVSWTDGTEVGGTGQASGGCVAGGVGVSEELTYAVVGGPKDGRTVTLVGDARVIRFPVVASVEVSRKVVPFRRGPDMEVAEYRRVGGVLWWDGLIDDAWSEMAISVELFLTDGTGLRRLVREELRHSLEKMAGDKGLDRILWRVSQPEPWIYRVRALVGPRRVERGAHERSERRGGVTVGVKPVPPEPSEP